MKRLSSAILLSGLAFAAAQGTTTLPSALKELEDTSRSFLLITSAVLLVAGAAGAGIGAFVYLKKLKGVEKREPLWTGAALLFGGGGAISLIGGILGLLIAFLMPAIVQSLISAP
ncbi:MAG: hypothetical protein AB1529_04325 [Candidatus Micrarchaeota archaeon]